MDRRWRSTTLRSLWGRRRRAVVLAVAILLFVIHLARTSRDTPPPFVFKGSVPDIVGPVEALIAPHLIVAPAESLALDQFAQGV